MRNTENLSLREAIVELVAAHSPISTKKICKILNKKLNNSISYQGVHKSLKKLTEQNKLLKQDGEFYLSSKTINHFLTTAVKNLQISKSEKALPFKTKNPVNPSKKICTKNTNTISPVSLNA